MNILICVHSEGGYAPLRFISGDISFLLAMSQYSYQFSRTPESAHGILNTVYNAPNVYRPLCNFPRFLRYIAQSPRNKGNGLDWALAFWPCVYLLSGVVCYLLSLIFFVPLPFESLPDSFCASDMLNA